MITSYLILLVLSSLFCLSVYQVFQPGHIGHKIGCHIDHILTVSRQNTPERQTEAMEKGLFVSNKGPELYVHLPIWKSIKGCFVCMSSFWGSFFFIYIHLIAQSFDWMPFEIELNLLYIYPVFILILSIVNRIIGRIADL